MEEQRDNLNISRTWPLVLIAVASILFLRKPQAILQANFYAEDGLIFFKQQYESGFWAALSMPYAGYLHYVPRLIAALCSFLPLEILPTAYALTALLVAAATQTFFIAPGFREVIRSDRLRVLIVLLWCLMPNIEGLMKVAFINWYMLLFTGLLTVYTLPKGRLAQTGLFLMAFIAAASSPVTVVCLPMMLLRSIKGRDRGEKLWWGALMVVFVLFTLFVQPSVPLAVYIPDNHDWIKLLFHAIGYRVFYFFTIGSTLAEPWKIQSWDWVNLATIALVGLFGIATHLAAKKSETESGKLHRQAPVMIFYLVLMLPVMMMLRPQWLISFWNLTEDAWFDSGRYFFCSTLMLCLLSGIIYERLIRDQIGQLSPKKRGIFLAAGTVWLTLHLAGFKFADRMPGEADWAASTKEIRGAEMTVLQTGKRNRVWVQSCTDGFSYMLRITPEAAKRNVRYRF